mmetsp:Transcript_52537/g.162500  ORF Transcript_52537/g.162500 Transcript_52537/m.162500 type:complete len:623 (-) Transcript_52537:12-1880(-)
MQDPDDDGGRHGRPALGIEHKSGSPPAVSPAADAAPSMLTHTWGASWPKACDSREAQHGESALYESQGSAAQVAGDESESPSDTFFGGIEMDDCARHMPSTQSSNATVGIVPQEILRGVPLPRLLRRTTRPWRTGPGSLSARDKGRLWALSEPVQEIDCFLSHAWQAPGWAKYIQLAIRSGCAKSTSRACAMLALLVFCLALLAVPSTNSYEDTILDWSGTMHTGMWCTLLVPPAALALLFCVPAFPKACARDPVVFLDVACICQTDDALRAAGIRALGGFLKHSRELHIMWSPEYFSRLWCVYELAAFLRLHGGGHVRFRPVFMEVALLVYFVFHWLASMLVMACLFMGMEHHTWPLVALGAGNALLLHCVHLLRRWMRDMRALSQQLAEFDVRHAECREADDHARILLSIQKWYGSEDSFNEQVRGKVRLELMRTKSASCIHYLTALAVGSTAPACASLDVLAGQVKSGVPWEPLIGTAVSVATTVFLLGPAFARLLFYLTERFAARRSSRLADWGTTFALFACWEAGLVLFKGGSLLACRQHLLYSVGASTASAVLFWAVSRWARLPEPGKSKSGMQEGASPQAFAAEPSSRSGSSNSVQSSSERGADELRAMYMGAAK